MGRSTVHPFALAWRGAGPAITRCLELAHAALVAGGLAVGAVLTDPRGAVAAEGRNHAYDPPSGTARLQGSPLAHAELNALAEARTEWDLSGYTLWSTQEPCSMCAGAAAFTRVGTVRYLAADPWAVSAGRSGEGAAVAGYYAIGPAEDSVWAVSATLLFLLSVAVRRGLDHPTVEHARGSNPATHSIVSEIVANSPPLPGSVTDLLDASWQAISAAAQTPR